MSSRLTCDVCRTRKVKCDGQLDVCSNCRRLGFACSYSDTQHRTPHRTVHIPRQRVGQACQTCHARKARCDGQVPRCHRCQRLNLECVYTRKRRTAESTISPQSSLQDSADERVDVHHNEKLPNQRVMISVLETFFSRLHHVPVFSFLHKASLLQRYHAGLADEGLLLALFGITSLLADLGPGLRESGARCIDIVERRMFCSFDVPSVIKLQTLVFVAMHRILSKRFGMTYMLISAAARYAFGLRLNYEKPELCFLARESCRRLMWAVFLLDATLSSGMDDFSVCRADLLHIQLPCSERNFELDEAQITEPLQIPSVPQNPSSTGLQAWFIRMFWIRIRILRFTKEIQSNTRFEPGKIEKDIFAFDAELKHFAESLPSSIKLTETNLRLRAYSARLPPFIMIFVSWYQCYCILYRLGLPGLREALSNETLEQLGPDFIEHCHRKCYEHTLAVIDIFTTILDLKADLPFIDIILPVGAYQSAKLLYYLYRNRGNAYKIELQDVHRRANKCLELVNKSLQSDMNYLEIKADLEALIEQGRSNSPTSLQVSTPLETGSDGQPMTPATQQVFSRHGLMSRVTIEDDTGALTLNSPIKAMSTGSGISPKLTESAGGHLDTGPDSAMSAQAQFPGDNSTIPNPVDQDMQGRSMLGNIVIDSLDSGYEFDWTSAGFESLAWGQDHDAFAGIDLNMDFQEMPQDGEDHSTLNPT